MAARGPRRMQLPGEVSLEANKRAVERLWQTLYTKDWDALAALLHDEVFYEDVRRPTPARADART